jgi:hypothetical protein
MTWISIVFYILTNIPKLISLIIQIWNIIKGYPQQNKENVRLAMSDAVQFHKQTKDDSKILNVHKQVCLGIFCPSEIKN